MNDKVRLVVLFGGRSAEHDVSCESAFHVLAAVDRDRFDVELVGITRDGRWVAAGDAVAALDPGARALPSPDRVDAPEIDPLPVVAPSSSGGPVVVFPVVHGPMGEDGTVQGMLELAGVPYVGAGVLASALCMDKAMAKDLLARHGIPQVRWLSARVSELGPAFADRVESELGFPVFVKPSNMGSSIGVTKAQDKAALGVALAEALRYDEYVVVEEAIAHAREIELAVLGDTEPRASVPGEVAPSHEFYDYEDKYLDGKAGLIIPAVLDSSEIADAQRLALAAYKALRVDGMARVDLFYDDGEGGRGFLVNELNTIPGFTPISMYPKLWEASGLPYPDLIEELVRLAIERHERRRGFETDR